jgi:hypothetical protein
MYEDWIQHVYVQRRDLRAQSENDWGNMDMNKDRRWYKLMINSIYFSKLWWRMALARGFMLEISPEVTKSGVVYPIAMDEDNMSEGGTRDTNVNTTRIATGLTTQLPPRFILPPAQWLEHATMVENVLARFSDESLEDGP